jgi:hypothetical protein
VYALTSAAAAQPHAAAVVAEWLAAAGVGPAGVATFAAAGYAGPVTVTFRGYTVTFGG